MSTDNQIFVGLYLTRLCADDIVSGSGFDFEVMEHDIRVTQCLKLPSQPLGRLHVVRRQCVAGREIDQVAYPPTDACNVYLRDQSCDVFVERGAHCGAPPNCRHTRFRWPQLLVGRGECRDHFTILSKSKILTASRRMAPDWGGSLLQPGASDKAVPSRRALPELTDVRPDWREHPADGVGAERQRCAIFGHS